MGPLAPSVALLRRRPRILRRRRGRCCRVTSAPITGIDDAGTLRPGHLADLVVLDRDIFTEPAEEIRTARVLQTWWGIAGVLRPTDGRAAVAPERPMGDSHASPPHRKGPSHDRPHRPRPSVRHRGPAPLP
ncbi:amidohydrolase family protein [Streptomyces sp. NPDC056255]|uniref:amidohydrolase family protein n=1 Tax=Streptomyces sp. NPDC056255 TaxID=3345764 RepID=UPI0035D581B4